MSARMVGSCGVACQAGGAAPASSQVQTQPLAHLLQRAATVALAVSSDSDSDSNKKPCYGVPACSVAAPAPLCWREQPRGRTGWLAELLWACPSQRLRTG